MNLDTIKAGGVTAPELDKFWASPDGAIFLKSATMAPGPDLKALGTDAEQFYAKGFK
jgi:hypothetical protein